MTDLEEVRVFTDLANSMLTGNAGVADYVAAKRWVLFDGECSWCTALVKRFGPTLRKRGFELAPLQTPWVCLHFALSPEELLAEMKVLTSHGSALGGGDRLVYLAREIWWAWPVVVAASLPHGLPIVRRVYRWIAAHRTCANGACARSHSMTIRANATRKWPGWMPLAILPAFALALRHVFEPWALMWALAVSVYAGCKWLTWWPYINLPSTRARHLGYLLAWPGMDAEDFLRTDVNAAPPSVAHWGWAVLKTISGASLLWAGVRRIPNSLPLFRGWTGLVGLVSLLHFGAFHLLALLWQAGGVTARPLMRTPALATSLAEFWGRRWNAGFHQLAHRLVFKPLRSRIGARGAVLVVFLASGLVHDLVISFPAGGGFGLPTGYFLLQAAGLCLERSERGRRWGLGRGAPGWLFTLAVTAAPAFWLFHPWFVLRVIVPFLKTVRAV